MIAVKVAHDVHVSVICQGVLCDKINVRAYFGGVDHVGGYKASGVGTAEENGIGFHSGWIGFTWVGGPLSLKFFRVGIPVKEVVTDAVNPAELPVAELPAEVVSVLFSASDDFELAGVVIVFIDEGEGEEENEGGSDQTSEGIVFD